MIAPAGVTTCFGADCDIDPSPMKLVLAAVFALAAAPSFAQAPAPPAPAPAVQAQGARAVAVLQALDKVTGRVRTLEVPAGDSIEFRQLAITVRGCTRRPPEEPPEASVFLEVRERRGNEPPRLLYSGWMFASSPAVAALEHPVYDVWVTDCRTATPTATPTPAPAPRPRQ
jgi:hypothetical protein